MARWFTSDGHFWHRNVITYEKRPYPLTDGGVLQMNEDMVTKWNEVVKPDDTVYYIGDFSLSFRSVEVYTPRLNGHKQLVLGNHDWAHPAHKRAKTFLQQEKWRKKYIDCGWEEVHVEHFLRIGPDQIRVRLYHMPYLNEQDGKQNHKKFRLEDDGIPLICGHVHSRFKMRLSRALTPQVNAGVDVHNFYPIGEETVIELMNQMMSPDYVGPGSRHLKEGDTS
jgi:calcineurin-like phosphoesterase family protein